MTWMIRSQNEIALTAQEYGLDPQAIFDIFGLRAAAAGNAPKPLAGCPADAAAFWAREYLASEPFVARLTGTNSTLPNPFGADQPRLEPKGTAFLAPAAVPGAYVTAEFEMFGAGDRSIVIAMTELYPRVTHIVFPAQRLVIYFLSKAVAHALPEVFETSGTAEAPIKFRAVPQRPVVAYLDNVNNHGHQLLNGLAGLQRLMDAGAADKIHELWVRGFEFYGKAESIFPEFAGRVRRFSTPQQLADALSGLDKRAFRVGSCFATTALRDRILQNAGGPSPPVTSAERPPLVVITLRTGSRVCSNLVETACEIFHTLQVRNPKTRIIIDGWVNPESASWTSDKAATASTPQHPQIREELAIAEAMKSKLPAGAVADILVGKSMLESLAVVRHATAYFSHVGTLQHKVANFSGMPGMVHGPVIQMQRREAGHYLTEAGVAPVFLEPDDVVDSDEVDIGRGGLAQSYAIRNPQEVAKRFADLALGRA